MRTRFFFLLAVPLLTLAAYAQTPAPAPVPPGATIEQLMTPEEFKSAGLKKLSPAELERLNDFLRGFRKQTEQAAVDRVVPPPSPNRGSTTALIESSIVGNFDGLKGRSRWLLANGQVWQQGNETEKFVTSLKNPDVALVRTSFGYKMVVSGVGKAFYVRQIVLP